MARMQRLLLVPILAVIVLGVALMLMPPERSVGYLLRVIFVHGALVQVAVGLFVLGALAALLALVTDHPRAWAWTRAAQVTALEAWLAGFIVSFYPSYVTWGAPIVWAEPRTQMMTRVLIVAVLVFSISRWVEDRRVIALGTGAVGLLVPFLVWRTAVIRHPLDPVGTSPSVALRVSYALVLASLAILGVWWTARLAERNLALPSTSNQPRRS